MSDEENRGRNDRIINVKIDDGGLTSEEKKQRDLKSARYDSIISEYRQSCAEKYNDPEFLSLTTEEQINELANFYQKQEGTRRGKRTVPKGVVSLKKPEGNTIFTDEFETPKEFVDRVYDAYRNEKDETRKIQIKQALDTLLEAKVHTLKDFDAVNFDLSIIPRGLKPNFGWKEYTKYLQRQKRREIK